MKKLALLALLFVAVTQNGFAQFAATLDGFPLVTTGWTVGGTSTVVDSTIRLTNPTTNQGGYVYYNTPVNLTNCGQFTVDFDYRVQVSSSSTVADGIAFWYISNPPTGFVLGGGIGLPANPNGLIMIMDTYDNIAPVNVPLATLLGYNGSIAGYTEGSTAGLLAPVAPLLTYITDGTWRHCKITYVSGTINVYFNYSTTATLSGTYPMSISGYFGFSSSTGAAYSTQSVKSVHITAVTALGHPTVVSPVTYCQGATATALTATGDPAGTMYWYTTDTATVVSLPGAPVPSTTTPGTYTYYVRQKAGTCVSPPDSIKVIINPKPAVPAITGVPFYCQGATFVPFAVTGSGILWYTAATGGTGSATAPTSPTAAAGNYTYYASQTLLGCESDRDSIKVRVHGTPLAPTLTSGTTTYCQYEAFVPLVVAGTNILWYTVPTGGVGSASAPVVNTGVAGVYNYYVSQSDSGCEGPRLNVTVTVNARPPAPAVTPTSYCQYAAAVPLTAAGVSLTWYGPGLPSSGTTAPPTPSTALTGTTTYYVTQTVSGCHGDSAALVVTVDSTPTTPLASSNSPICEGDTLFFTSSTATAGVSYNWTGPLSYTSTEQNPVIAHAVPGNSGPYILTVGVGSCSAAATIMVSVTPTPALVASSNSPVCTGDTLKLFAGVGAAGGVYTWSGPYTFSSGGQNPVRNPAVMEYGGTYVVSVYYNGCYATKTTNVVVNQTPAPPMMAWLTYCQYYNAWPLQAYGANILWYPSSSATAGSPTAPVPQTAVTGSTYYYASQTVLGCESIIDSMLVTVNPIPTINAMPSKLVCPRDSIKVGASVVSGSATYRWYPDAYLSDTTGDTVMIRPETDVHYYVVAANAYNCKDTATFDVSVESNAVLYLPDSVTIFPGESYQISPQTNCSNFRWSPAGGLTSAYISNPLAMPEVSTRYVVTASTEWGCKIADTIEVYVRDEPEIAIPNAFSPGSGPNNEFKLIKRGIAQLRNFRIYDRWGIVVYESKDIDKGWDGTYKGTPQPMGVYVYEVSAVSMSGKEFARKGNVTLLR